jgi:hypothetical protein
VVLADDVAVMDGPKPGCLTRPCPEGTSNNSPAFQRRESSRWRSPEGTDESANGKGDLQDSRPCGTRLPCLDPGVETPG